MQLPPGTYNTSYSRDMAVVRTRLQWVLLIVFLLFVFVAIPQIANRFWLSVLINIAIWIVATQGLNILLGYCGVPSMGHAGFMAVGAYTTAILGARYDLPFWVAMPCAGLAAAAVGAAFGVAALRVKTFYIVLATIAAALIIQYLISLFPSVTGGPSGIVVQPAKIGGIVLDHAKDFYYLAMAMAVLGTVFALNLARTRVGRALVAIRDNAIAAEAMGVNILLYKTIAFGICCFYAGIAGSLMAYYMMFVNTDLFTFDQSIWLMGTVLIGGAGTTAGPIFGTTFIQLLKQGIGRLGPKLVEAFPSVGAGVIAAIAPAVFGLVLMLVFIFEPRGLAHRWALFKAYYRMFPFSS